MLTSESELRLAKVRLADAERPQKAAPSVSETVERKDGPSKGRYRIVVDGVEAEMTNRRAGKELIIIDHTDVPGALRGRKVGERLVRQASRMPGAKGSRSRPSAHLPKPRSSVIQSGRMFFESN